MAGEETQSRGQGNRKNAWYRRTEKILYNYPTLNNAIKVQENTLAFMEKNKMPNNISRYGDDGPPSTVDRMSEPESYTDRRQYVREKMRKRLDMLRSRKEAIDKALMQMDEEHYAVVSLWYFQNWKLSQKGKGRPAWKELGMSRNTFTRRRHEVVREVARWLGELVDVE